MMEGHSGHGSAEDVVGVVDGTWVHPNATNAEQLGTLQHTAL